MTGTTTATLADIAVGDKIAVEGKLSGNSITARVIIDGIRPIIRVMENKIKEVLKARGGLGGGRGSNASSTGK